MKNLAGNKECDQTITEELTAAAIPTKEVEQTRSEVPYTVVGDLSPWELNRAWYYWMASAPEGQGLPEEIAETMNTTFSDVVRVAGFSGGTGVKEWLSAKGTIDTYHIDTQEGLNAFAAVVKTVREKVAAAAKRKR